MGQNQNNFNEINRIADMVPNINNLSDNELYRISFKDEWKIQHLSYLIKTYSMNTYVLLHSEHRNDVTIIVKLLCRSMCRRRVAL